MKYILRNENISTNYLKTLLEKRGILDFERYIYPTKENEINPHHLINIDLAARTLIDYLEKKTKILIILDSDQDGYTSAAILWQYIKRLYPNSNLHYRIHAGKQHGLEDMMDLIEEDFNLILIPDAGSNDYDYHKTFKEHGTEIIVLDHHEAESESEYAIVVNNQFSPEYENKSLSGAGVVYKFCQVLDEIIGVNYAKDYIDLAAVGIVGDMMSLATLENRYIVSHGLKNIKNVCLKALVDKQAFSIGDTNNLTPTSIAFYITPLINALIRVGKESEKESLFLALIDGNKIVPSTKRGAKGETETLSVQVARTCTNARARQNRNKEKAMELLEIKIFNDNLDKNKIIFIKITEEDEIDSVLTGLIAMQLMAKYKKPVIIARENNEGFYRGSARGDSKSELKDLKSFFQDSGYFEYAEGHASAHGVSIHGNKIDDFIHYSNKALFHVNFNEGVYEIDFLRGCEATDLYDLVLEIGHNTNLWGQGNDEPLFAITEVNLFRDDIKLIGANKETLKFEKNGITFIKFKASKLIEDLGDLKQLRMTIIGKANLNEWNGMIKPQLFIEDYNIVDAFGEF